MLAIEKALKNWNTLTTLKKNQKLRFDDDGTFIVDNRYGFQRGAEDSYKNFIIPIQKTFTTVACYNQISHKKIKSGYKRLKKVMNATYSTEVDKLRNLAELWKNLEEIINSYKKKDEINTDTDQSSDDSIELQPHIVEAFLEQPVPKPFEDDEVHQKCNWWWMCFPEMRNKNR